ncbi:hypothetical protein KV112_12555, partial [Mycolicibacter sp. MYC123]
NISSEKPTKTKTTPPTRGVKNVAKQQQTKTTKHTIEFSNNTPHLDAQSTRGLKAVGRQCGQ